MSLVFPDWFEHNFVNIENMLIDLFTKAVPNATSGTWTPDSWIDSATIDPMLSFVRLPGGVVDYDAGFDECMFQALAVTDSRNDSIELMSLVRAVLLPMKAFKFKMTDGYTALIHWVENPGGPQMMVPAQQIDTRVVPATFKIRVGLRSRKRYDQIIRDL